MTVDGITFYDLLHSLSDVEILMACFEIDPDNKEHYPEMLQALRKISPERTTLEIIISPIVEDDGFIWHDVSGREFGHNEDCGIEFLPWSVWLGATFSVEGANLTPTEIVAELLNEMSWGGWSNEERHKRLDIIQARAANLLDDLG